MKWQLILVVPAMVGAWTLLAIIAALCAVIPALDRWLYVPPGELEDEEWNAW